MTTPIAMPTNFVIRKVGYVLNISDWGKDKALLRIFSTGLYPIKNWGAVIFPMAGTANRLKITKYCAQTLDDVVYMVHEYH